jgi:hypothetical protein
VRESLRQPPSLFQFAAANWHIAECIPGSKTWIHLHPPLTSSTIDVQADAASRTSRPKQATQGLGSRLHGKTILRRLAFALARPAFDFSSPPGLLSLAAILINPRRLSLQGARGRGRDPIIHSAGCVANQPTCQPGYLPSPNAVRSRPSAARAQHDNIKLRSNNPVDFGNAVCRPQLAGSAVSMK